MSIFLRVFCLLICLLLSALVSFCCVVRKCPSVPVTCNLFLLVCSIRCNIEILVLSD